MKPITVHVVFNAHLDPVWMWPWTSGLDEAIGTARSACDRLDESPELFYTQGEVWTLQMVEKADPDLFKRICKHVAAGRWEVVNGWWVQPDCNFPTADGLRRQIEVGQKWVWEKFRLRTRCGFNPDSFGHCAKLPDILREHGQDRYVFMRPQEHEMDLPARVFAWRSRKGGDPVKTFRIGGSYLNGLDGGVWQWPLDACVKHLPPDCRHTMLFFGVGDHGGGPTKRLVRWVKENPNVIPGAKLEFSTIARFFAAIDKEKPTLPEVIGELQMHAVGCYTAVRTNKVALRRAEHALLRAEVVAAKEDAPRIARAWQEVCAHQFHDTLGGTAIPDAYTFVDGQLHGAASAADEITAYAVRRQVRSLPDDKLPRLVLANPGLEPFAGWAEGTIYSEGIWMQNWRLLDGRGREIAFQSVPTTAGNAPGWHWGLRRVLVKADIPANGLHVLRMDLSKPPAAIKPQVHATTKRLSNVVGAAIAPGASSATLLWKAKKITQVALHLIDDPTDTWSHGAKCYGEKPLAQPKWGRTRVQDTGPLMASIVQDGTIGKSQLSAEWRIYAGEPWIDLTLDVLWAETRKILKLVLPGLGGGGGKSRRDGTPGMAIVRPNNGREVPVHDFTTFGKLGVVSPDIFALDATPQRLRLTLLRAPYMAQHDPMQVPFPRGVIADQGKHRFRIRFWLAGASEKLLAQQALGMHRPPLAVELTRGMPARWTEYVGADKVKE